MVPMPTRILEGTEGKLRWEAERKSEPGGSGRKNACPSLLPRSILRRHLSFTQSNQSPRTRGTRCWRPEINLLGHRARQKRAEKESGGKQRMTSTVQSFHYMPQPQPCPVIQRTSKSNACNGKLKRSPHRLASLFIQSIISNYFKNYLSYFIIIK